MAKLSKIVKIKQEDYSTLLSEGQVTIDGVTHVYDPDALYTVVDPAAPEYAESAGYAANAGTAQAAVTDANGNNIVQTYGKKPLVIEVSENAQSVPSGTYSSITQAIASNREVKLKVAASDSPTIMYLSLSYDEDEEEGMYGFNFTDGIADHAAGIFSDDSFRFNRTNRDYLLVHKEGTETITGDKTFSGTTTFTGTTNLGSKATATTPAATDNDTSVATTAFVKTAISGKQDTLVSGTNIKTVNGCSLVGSGNVTISIDECNLVHKTGDEIIGGIKCFSYISSHNIIGSYVRVSNQLLSPNCGYFSDGERLLTCGCYVAKESQLATKLTRLTFSIDNAVVRFNGVCGDIQNSGVTINDSNQVTAAKFITSGGTSSQFVKGDGSLDSKIYLDTTYLPYWANIKTDMAPQYNTEPEFKSIKINGSSSCTCGGSTENAVIQYDTATKVVKFVFN